MHVACLLRDRAAVRAEASEHFLDVFHEGFAFRLHLFSDRCASSGDRVCFDRTGVGLSARKKNFVAFFLEGLGS